MELNDEHLALAALSLEQKMQIGGVEGARSGLVMSGLRSQEESM